MEEGRAVALTILEATHTGTRYVSWSNFKKSLTGG